MTSNKSFPHRIGEKERRRLKAEQKKNIGAWYGLGLVGIVGWSVVIPTLLGIFLGVWVDIHWPSPRSWTLMLMVLGLFIGCLCAGFWVNRQRQQIMKERTNEDR
ncbi:AtpZ/AtpI family protein [Halodesulfovibrio aestuarii]|uniref:ATP synthase protein I n=1 Tax=Halodesulfovibrio aestuarii TaxID=126333 RepID=A0A8G2C8L0_9BACT|nr:AtpZ/AtpI family protein [Halodesulfovibrio aestuarii]SHI83098.1 ATP synthase protein I [Halodesulfovibrio aestuarii]